MANLNECSQFFSAEEKRESFGNFAALFELKDEAPPILDIFLDKNQELAVYRKYKTFNDSSRCLFGEGLCVRNTLLKMEKFHIGFRSIGTLVEDCSENFFYKVKMLKRFLLSNPGTEERSEDSEERFYSLSDIGADGHWRQNFKERLSPFCLREERNFCLYIHKNKINGKIYVGITKDPVHRWGKEGETYVGSPFFYSAICKYGWENFEHCILKDGLTQGEAEKAEIEAIEKLEANNPQKGYNLTKGGRNRVTRKELVQRGLSLSVWDINRRKYNYESSGVSLNNLQFMTWYLWAFWDIRVAVEYKKITGSKRLFKPLDFEQGEIGRL